MAAAAADGAPKEAENSALLECSAVPLCGLFLEGVDRSLAVSLREGSVSGIALSSSVARSLSPWGVPRERPRREVWTQSH